MNDPIYHVSPDGLLALTVQEDSHGECEIGFHGFDWRVPASQLAELSGTSSTEAVQRFVADILHDRALIAVLRVAQEMSDVWVTAAPEADWQFQQPGERLEFRYWSGKPARLEF
ncbi:MAG: hypothetical protein KDA45_11780 [Planctomycetales bacterium]|nr:hypothetical protein [Planctomycetales bacterium]